MYSPRKTNKNVMEFLESFKSSPSADTLNGDGDYDDDNDNGDDDGCDHDYSYSYGVVDNAIKATSRILYLNNCRELYFQM